VKLESDFRIDTIIDAALEEDIGNGDITTASIIDSPAKGKARLIAKEEILLAGLGIFKRVLTRIDPDITVKWNFDDGDTVPRGHVIGKISGSLQGILTGERTALNFLQHLSGIATLTKKYVDKIDPSKIKVLDTRKTTPGLRILEKYAVRVGGGFNHRLGLFDGILVKDNHIAAAGSITKALQKVRETAPHTLKVEVEVEDSKGLEEAIAAGADVVLLDNMSLEDMKKAVLVAKGKVLLEASGGVTLETVGEIGRTGVNLVSVGALTHSARSVDISLEVD